MERDSFIFYRSWHEAIKHLPAEVQGEIYTAVIEYCLYGKETNSMGKIANAIFTLIRPQADANRARYENGCKGGEYGSLGGRPGKYKNPNETPKKPLKNPNETPNVYDNDNDLKKDISLAGYIQKNNSASEVVFENAEKSESDFATVTEKTGTGLAIADNAAKKQLCEKRKNDFMYECAEYTGTYGKEMIRNFFDYWTEKNKSQTKMRFEMEKTWDLARRIENWSRNELKFQKNGKIVEKDGSGGLDAGLAESIAAGIARAKAGI